MLVTVLVIAAILAFVLFVMKMLSLGGWSRLHNEYPAFEEPVGQKWRFAYAFIGKVNYDGIRVVEAEKGLYLAAGCLHVFHGAILIPWTALRCEGIEKEEFLYGTLHLSVATMPPPIELTLYDSVAISVGKRFPASARSGRIRIGWRRAC